MADLTLASLYDVVRGVEQILGPFPVLVLAVDSQGRIVMSNEAARTAFGVAEVEMIDRPVTDFVPGIAWNQTAKNALSDSPQKPAVQRRRDGSAFPVEVHTSVHQLGDDKITFVALHDVTERLQADRSVRESQQTLDIVLAGLPAMVSAKDPDGLYEFINPFQAEVYGVDPAAAVGRDTADLLGAPGRPIDRMDRKLLAGDAVSRTEEERLLDAEGRQRRFLTTRAVLRDAKGIAQRLLSVSLDVTHGSVAEERLERLALIDDRTGLPNRIALRQVLGAQIRASRRDNAQLGAIVFSIDNLREIGTDLGEDARDGVLRRVAIRLGGLVAEDAVIARYDDQSFAVVASQIDGDGILEQESARLIARAGRTVTVAGTSVELKCRAGVALYPDNGIDADDLLRAAELAANERSGPTVVPIRRYADDMADRLRNRRDIEQGLRRDLEQDRFSVRYRPVLSLESRQTLGFETDLVDGDDTPIWRSTAAHEGSPLSIAEREGLIVPIGEWMIRRACTDAATWASPVPVAITLHAQQVHQPDLVEMVEDVLAETELAPARLLLAIDASVATEDPDLATGTLAGLAGLGLQLSLNDFGSCASSLMALRRLPIGSVTLGAPLVGALPADGDAVLVASAATKLAQTLDLSVRASGVETGDQLEFLKDRGCVAASGAAVGDVMTASAVAALLAQDSALAG